MAIDVSAVGKRTGSFIRSWDSRDALLYALSVGAGQVDAAQELHFTTENSAGVEQRVIPSLVIPLVQAGLARILTFGDFPRGALVHAEQALTVHRPLAPAGTVKVSAHIASIVDKGSGALVHMETEAVDAESGEPVASTRFGYFIRGHGGFGGEHGDVVPTSWAEPSGAPDRCTVIATRPDQALLYRLNGDRNPIHSDPTAAVSAGFPRPILHGLATYGITTRVLVNDLLDSDPGRLRAISARFTKPVFPGDTLVLQSWRTGSEVQFRVVNEAGVSVLDRGNLIGDLADNADLRKRE